MSLLARVPYLAQTESLCGGAALAMVLRYWGAQGVYAEDFTALADEAKGGIDTAALARAPIVRGYRSVAFSGSIVDLKHHLQRGRPLVVLLQLSQSRYHYVVIVGMLGNRVVFHDPARAPFRRMAFETFDRAWMASGRWALLVLPGDESRVDRDLAARPHESAAEVHEAARLTPDSADPERSPGVCDGLTSKAVKDAGAGRLADAEQTLGHAIARCPNEPAPVRELAGLRLLQKRWTEARAAAARAVALDPDDEHAWELLGASRYLEGDPDGALAAWNVLGKPRIDLLEVDGLIRLPYRSIADGVPHEPGSLLTRRNLQLARRRLDELPALQSAMLEYRPTGGGSANLRAAVVERPLFDRSPTSLIATALQATFGRELIGRASSPLGTGEVWIGRWRWAHERPRAMLEVSVPHPSGLPGTWTVDALWDRQAYGGSGIVREERSRGALRMDDWIHPSVRLAGRVALDRWSGHGLAYSVGGGPELRLLGDRGAVRLDGEWWLSGSRFSHAALDTAWRTSTHEAMTFQAFGRAGVQLASREAPLGVWPGAGSGHTRSVPLRAHPLLHDGVVQGEAFGRKLVYLTAEAQTWRPAKRLVRLGGAVFIDSAKAWARPDGGSSPFLVDVGAGIRLAAAGYGTEIRADVAHSVTDGRTTFSAGWVKSWPDW